jgi:hypothetical protein
MSPKFKPFAEGEPCPKQVLSLGFYRTGSRSLKEALTILGYKNVFHSSGITDIGQMVGFGAGADDNIPSLPTYTGKTWTREQWDEYFGPCEALTDVTPYALPMLRTYPEAKVILVHRDFDSWATSYLQTLAIPSSTGILAWLSGNVFEPVLGLHVSQTLWKFYMGLFGVCDLRKARDRRIMRAGYDNHYDTIRRVVPPENLLDIELEDLDWKPLCEFLGKDVPDVPFPRTNESAVYQNGISQLHRLAFLGGLTKILLGLTATGGAFAAAVWTSRRLMPHV